MIRMGWLVLAVWVGMGSVVSSSWAAEGKAPQEPAAQEEKKGSPFTQEEKNFSALTMGFYQHPEPEKLMNAFLAIKDLNAFFHRTEKTPDDGRAVIASQVTVVFFGSLIRKQPALATSLTRLAVSKGSDLHKIVLAEAIARSGIKKRDDALNTLIKSISAGFLAEKGKDDAQARKAREMLFAQIRQQPALDFNKLQIVHPGQIDLLWAAFFATGDKEYVSRVTKHLEYWLPKDELKNKINELSKQKRTPQILDEVRRHLVSAAAGWSLGANAQHLPEVRATLEKFAASNQGQASKSATRILRSLDDAK